MENMGRRYNYHVANMLLYCNEKGISPVELTLEEREPFILDKDQKEKYRYLAYVDTKPCLICGEATGRLSHGFETYICGQECFDVFQANTEEENGEWYSIKREAVRQWHKRGIERLRGLGYSPEEIVKRIPCSLDDIQEFISEIEEPKNNQWGE